MDMATALPSAARILFEEYIRSSEEKAAKAGPFAAEITPSRPALWHLLMTEPSRESLAASHLIGRRFAIYLPVFGADVVLPNSGQCRAGKPLFPGYLFVFVWDIFKHWRRIHACPGVARVVTADDDRPVVVPDKVIDDIQVLEAVNGELAKEACRAGRRGYRRRRSDRKIEQATSVTISGVSRFGSIGPLDDETRISALHKALGLASNAP